MLCNTLDYYRIYTQCTHTQREIVMTTKMVYKRRLLLLYNLIQETRKHQAFNVRSSLTWSFVVAIKYVITFWKVDCWFPQGANSQLTKIVIKFNHKNTQ